MTKSREPPQCVLSHSLNQCHLCPDLTQLNISCCDLGCKLKMGANVGSVLPGHYLILFDRERNDDHTLSSSTDDLHVFVCLPGKVFLFLIHIPDSKETLVSPSHDIHLKLTLDLLGGQAVVFGQSMDCLKSSTCSLSAQQLNGCPQSSPII